MEINFLLPRKTKYCSTLAKKNVNSSIKSKDTLTLTMASLFFTCNYLFAQSRYIWFDFVLLMSNFRCPANSYLFKVNNKNIWKRCQMCSKLTMRTTEKRQSRRSGVFIILMSWTYSTPFSNVSIVEFEQVNIWWEDPIFYIKPMLIKSQKIFKIAITIKEQHHICLNLLSFYHAALIVT